MSEPNKDILTTAVLTLSEIEANLEHVYHAECELYGVVLEKFWVILFQRLFLVEEAPYEYWYQDNSIVPIGSFYECLSYERYLLEGDTFYDICLAACDEGSSYLLSLCSLLSEDDSLKDASDEKLIQSFFPETIFPLSFYIERPDLVSKIATNIMEYSSDETKLFLVLRCSKVLGTYMESVKKKDEFIQSLIWNWMHLLRGTGFKHFDFIHGGVLYCFDIIGIDSDFNYFYDCHYIRPIVVPSWKLAHMLIKEREDSYGQLV